MAVTICLASVFPVLSAAIENPYAHLVAEHVSGSLDVDLGYASYRGSYNSTTELNSWLGVRFAEAPINKLRWQKPVPPKSKSDRNEPIEADTYSKACPQSPLGSIGDNPFEVSSTQSEDCLFLNVWAPRNATNLPVLVWIHGGGYGEGSTSGYPMESLVDTTGHRFIAVSIQYRLSAFGFLSSEEVKQSGTPNAGLYDQLLALQWVQRYIKLFGGDPSNVTIFGESAGAGSVMLLSMAYGGTLGTSLFQNLIAASPYLPMQHDYAGAVPSKLYHELAASAGCIEDVDDKPANTSIFECLVGKDTETLQNASYTISVTGNYGQWAFLPVTDHSLIQELPSEQLLKKQVNGKRMLVGNNADEAPRFTPPTINTQDDFEGFIRYLFPQFKEDEIEKTLLHYPSTTDPVDKNATRFATTGTGEPTALNMSAFASGQQQRAFNLYSEVTFVCPAYWMAESFSEENRTSHFYQYSILPTEHGADVNAYFGPLPDTMSPEFQVAMRSFLNSFIVTGNPGKLINSTISDEVAKVLKAWPEYSLRESTLMNMNQTGGHPVDIFLPDIGSAPPFEDIPARDYNVTLYKGSDMQPKFNLADAYSWEGGRGKRCDFWRSMGSLVPM
ncbi:hypothetical protein ASPWEDRAFT_110676 [Aspergillus wentii DTO 134E9]|uniref:Carboxylic ester hydrolase n=1 Tax=Aspergillus wentii DTO 134E9 TaxID=1073089 RepID=A0A1L9RKY5_ASPWE|nr:uncharacterized protein ASPWEDRAFT_110676 [Aspergillus wentii DTO 134E9]OJJ35595.1 hypothetical protein ASPWEDRAFT_110676 [Aspergillus wentii DTO 134E9]